MRHNVVTKTFNRDTEHRKAMLKNLAVSLVENESIKTTVEKAKYLRPFIEKALTKARAGTIAAIRETISKLGSESAARKLVKDIAPRYMNRNGGYTRIVRLGNRDGDKAALAKIEFVQEAKIEEKEEPKAKATKAPRKKKEVVETQEEING